MEYWIWSIGVLKLSERYREEGLDHKCLLVTTIKYIWDHRKTY